jgi:hypothetical protein
MAIRTEEAKMTQEEAKMIFDAADLLNPVLMRGVAIALRQKRGIAWLKKGDEQILFALGILIYDETGNPQIHAELMPYFCPPIRCKEGEAPVSETRSIYVNEDDLAPDQILEHRQRMLRGIKPLVVRGIRQ